MKKSDKRQVKIAIGYQPEYGPGRRHFFFGVFKMEERPEQGKPMDKPIKAYKHKGFMLLFNFWLPLIR